MLYSMPEYRADILGRALNEVPITDFLGSILDVHRHFEVEVYSSTMNVKASVAVKTDDANSAQSSKPTNASDF
ncbi:hypothetical protein, variant [Plasmopara halstedii]|uniref:Uncharacterized protein n=1 Tax=Plasmopara halstedii TaxID=4781 RepID=A0A0P1B390_PLAHL|nr:hypothetical protein, variant [Plasmopara halstedii]CEG49200.1 hypothetical protein, variant [Plasmopara halstedii]|eukprot:XP_024585569.1 hypothetical protein, variant [Plasmopara halstedii]